MAKPQKKSVKSKTLTVKPAAVRKPVEVETPVRVLVAPREDIKADDVVTKAEAETLVRPGRRVSVESVAAIAATPLEDLPARRGAAANTRWPKMERAGEVSGWEKIKRKLTFWRKRQDSMPEHLAAVKAGVLHELEALGVEKGVPLQGGPFRTVVLPTVRKRRGWGWPLVALVGVLLVLVMVWVGRGPATPDKALAQALGAVVGHDVSRFEERVDVGSVASSVVNQTFSAPQLDVAALPPELREQLLHGQNGDLASRMNAAIKPGLAENLRDEILEAVKTGKLKDNDGDLLAKLWRDLGGNSLQAGAPRIVNADAHGALAEVPLRRTDLGLTLPLQVVLTRGAEGWQVVDIPNLAAVLDGMVSAETAKLQSQRGPVPQDVAGRVEVSNVLKAKGMSRGGSLMVTMTVRNAGDVALRDVQLSVAFGDAAGQPMKSTIVTLDGVLGAGQAREQTWAVPVDRSRAAERYVADLPLSALSVKVVPVGAR